jgi:hypothetical protein
VNKETPKLREEAFVCMFCGHTGHLDEFCFRHKRIEKMCFDYTRNSYHDEFSDFLPRSFSRALSRTSSRALSHSLIDLTIAHMILVHERTILCLDALVTTHVLIMVIISRVGLAFLLEGLALTLSPDTWMVHIFSVVVHVPLGQMVKCKEV